MKVLQLCTRSPGTESFKPLSFQHFSGLQWLLRLSSVPPPSRSSRYLRWLRSSVASLCTSRLVTAELPLHVAASCIQGALRPFLLLCHAGILFSLAVCCIPQLFAELLFPGFFKNTCFSAWQQAPKSAPGRIQKLPVSRAKELTLTGPLQRGRDKTLLLRTMSASTPCLAAGPLELSSTCFRSSGCCLTCLSCSPGVSVTSSNTGVPDISGSVYSKTQVSVWFVLQEGAVLLRSTSLALRAPSQAMRSLPLGAASQGGGKCLASPSLEQLSAKESPRQRARLFSTPRAACWARGSQGREGARCSGGKGSTAHLPPPTPYSAVGVSSPAILREAGISHWNPSGLLQLAFGTGQRWPHQPCHGGCVPPHAFHAHPDPTSATPLADPPPPPAAGRAGKHPPALAGASPRALASPPAPLSLLPSRPAADTRGHTVTRTCSHLHIHTGLVRGEGEEGPGCAPLGGTQHRPLAAGCTRYSRVVPLHADMLVRPDLPLPRSGGSAGQRQRGDSPQLQPRRSFQV